MECANRAEEQEAGSDGRAGGSRPQLARGGHLHHHRALGAADRPLCRISELNGRAGFYLASVSSGLIALAFIAQLSRPGTAFHVFGLVLLPTLAFVGVTTFERALRNRVEDVQLADRMNRIRQYYIDAAPQVARYLPPPSEDVPAATAPQSGGSSPS
jgi:hypothetical protein